MKLKLSNTNLTAIIDSEDFSLVSNHTWYLEKSRSKSYPRSRIKGKLVRLHRFITNAKKGQYVDHINGNTLDNRKCNLKICTNSENIRNTGLRKNNTSGYTGIYHDKKNNKYIASIYNNYKTMYVGTFNCIQKANKARQNKLKQLGL